MCIVLIFASRRLWSKSSAHVQRYCQCPQFTSSLENVSACEWHPFLLPFAHLDPSSIREADSNIVEYLHPYAQFIAAVFAFELRSIQKAVEHELRKTSFAPDGDFEEKLENLFRKFTKLNPSLVRSHHHLSQFLEKHEKSPKMIRLLRDYETLVNQAKELQSEMALYFQMEIFTRTWDEATLARKISFIAFGFFPLSLTATIFGMDVEGLIDKKVSTVIVTAIVLIVICFVLSFLARKKWSFRHRFRYLQRYKNSSKTLIHKEHYGKDNV